MICSETRWMYRQTKGAALFVFLVLNDIPHDLAVDSKIFVNQDISKSGDLFPVDTGSVLASVFGEMFCGFSDHFQISHNRIESFVVLQEVLRRESARIRFHFPDCGENIFGQKLRGADPSFRLRGVRLRVLPEAKGGILWLCVRL